MSDIVRIKYFIRTDKVGSDCEGEAEFDRDDWEAMTEEEREAEMKEAAFEHMEWGYREDRGHE